MPDDVTDEAHANDDAWIEISCHPKVRRQLKEWGKRLGMSADGMAKLLLLGAMHPLVAAELGEGAAPIKEPAASVSRFTNSQNSPEPDVEGDVSLNKWRTKLAEYAGRMDMCPAPSGVVQGTRLYAARDFQWADGAPAWDVYQVDPEGGDGVSR